MSMHSDFRMDSFRSLPIENLYNLVISRPIYVEDTLKLGLSPEEASKGYQSLVEAVLRKITERFHIDFSPVSQPLTFQATKGELTQTQQKTQEVAGYCTCHNKIIYDSPFFAERAPPSYYA